MRVVGRFVLLEHSTSKSAERWSAQRRNGVGKLGVGGGIGGSGSGSQTDSSLNESMIATELLYRSERAPHSGGYGSLFTRRAKYVPLLLLISYCSTLFVYLLRTAHCSMPTQYYLFTAYCLLLTSHYLLHLFVY